MTGESNFIEFPKTYDTKTALEFLDVLREEVILSLDVDQMASIHALSDFLSTLDFDSLKEKDKYQYVRSWNVINNIFHITGKPHLIVNIDKMFDRCPLLASYWMGQLFTSKNQTNPETNYNNQKIKYLHRDYTIGDLKWVFEHQEVTHPYFDITYIDDSLNKPVREKINQSFKEAMKGFAVDLSNRDKKVIFVISGGMERGHVVERSCLPYIMQLKDYDLILINHAGELKPRKEFKETINLHGKGMDFLLTKVLEYKPYMILFPEIGLSQTSIQLSNMRMAPVQVTMHGHPVSTWGGEIDYFIGGKYDNQKDFSEKLIKMDNSGLTCIPVLHGYVPPKTEKTGKIIIGLSWGNVKINLPLLCALRDGIKGIDVELRFFSIIGKGLLYLTTWIDLRDFFNADVKLSCAMPLPEYLATMEQCDFMLDSYPFGSHNRVIDALLCGVPVLTVRGDKAYNNFGCHIAEYAGMPVTTFDKLSEEIRKWCDRDYLKTLTINNLDDLCNDHKKDDFSKAIDSILKME